MTFDIGMPLNPWDDALEIARGLQRPGAELTVVIGAEAWCDKCRRLRPVFEAMHRSQAIPSAGPRVSLWLDLEDHAELLGRFVPDDLPLLLRWRDGACVQAAVILGAEPRQPPVWRLGAAAVPADLPDLWGGFAAGVWKSS